MTEGINLMSLWLLSTVFIYSSHTPELGSVR
jgi:hypothetical protein